MDGLETPYEVEGGVEFIDCTVCNKSIRGDTLYKIHLTTIGHIKKEDTLVESGEAFREHIVPDFKNIKEYLQYLKLDEPIIGLNLLEEVFVSKSFDPQPGPRYICQLCDLEANLPNMANHIVGRRHRQKYLEVKRKDLVTWSSNSLYNQFGKAIRAKAEVVERQEGQGSPKPLRRNQYVGKGNILRVPQNYINKQLQKGAPHAVVNSSLMPHQAQLTDLHGEYDQHGNPYAQPYCAEEPYMSADAESQAYAREYNQKSDFVEEELRRADYMDDKPRRREFTKGYRQRQNQDDYTEDARKRDSLQEDDAYRSGYPEAMPQHIYSEDIYHQEQTPHKKAYPENDPLKQFYSEEVQRRVLSTQVAEERPFKGDDSCGNSRVYGRHGPTYSEEDPQRHHFSQETGVGQVHTENNFVRGSVELDYDHRKGFGEDSVERRAVPNVPYFTKTRRAGYSKDFARHKACEPAFSGAPPNEPSYTKGSGEPQAKRHTFSEPLGKDGAYDKDHLFELLKTFRQEGRGQRQKEVEPDSYRRGSSTYLRPPEGAREMSNIPEPFKRFLAGAATDNNLQNSKRKRKSRFSDASKDEMDMLQEMQFHFPPGQIDEYGPSGPEPYDKPQVQYLGQTCQRERSQSRTDQSSGNVLDILNNIEIENLDEANFLKDKLLNLLSEFQAKKSSTGQRSHELDGISKEYNHQSKETLLESTRGRYERSVREFSLEKHNKQLRQPRELYYPDRALTQQRGRSLEQDRPQAWEEGKRLEKHRHTAIREEPRSSRIQIREAFGQVDQYPPRQPEKSRPYSERAHGSRYNRDYQSTVEDHNSYPSVSESGEYRINHGHHHSSLDKITSTLLELVARKS